MKSSDEGTVIGTLKGIWTISGTAMDAPGVFRGFVVIRAYTEDGRVLEGQLAPDEIRAMALSFLESAEASDQDRIVFTMLTRDLDIPPDVAATFIRRMRDEREKGNPPEPEDKPSA